MKHILFTGFAVTTLLFTACKGNEDKKEYTAEDKALIQKFYDAKDSTVINAYLDDKSTISSENIDMKDTTYSARIKILYKSVNDNKHLAVVMGLKAKESELGKAFYQVNTDKPVELAQVKSADANVREFATKDGSKKLQITGDFAFVQENGGSVQYERIK